MKKGYLSQYFEKVAIKTLSSVEMDVLTSNQHEFNGVRELRKMFGEPNGKIRHEARFLYFTDSDDEPISEDGFLTWYDARGKAREERGVMRSEYRLYFPTTQVSQCANAGDLLIIAKRPDKPLIVLVAEKDTTIARQLMWLFGFSKDVHPSFSVREELETEQDRIEFASRFILESIGVFVEILEETCLDEMIDRFDGAFPTTRVFSDYARSTLPDITPADGADAVLMAWLSKEEVLFRIFEKHLIGDRLAKGFDNDVDGFLSFALSTTNRRKVRAGLALENHLEIIFNDFDIRHSRTPVTEHKSKPDFIFPGSEEYKNPEFDSMFLTMLGAKSTCKDRWRQILPEAKRIKTKHLLTLEPAISTNQTAEMQSRCVQLVLPKVLHETYLESQQQWLMDVSEFIELVLQRQVKGLS